MKLYHYTVYPHLQRILKDKTINPTGKLIGRNERQAAWLSTNQDWEQTVRKRLSRGGELSELLDKDELFQVGVWPARIEVKPSGMFVNWRMYKKRSGITKNEAARLEKVAQDWGANPKEWWASFLHIPHTEWLAIEIWNGEKWVGLVEWEFSYQTKL